MGADLQRVKIFADGADRGGILELYAEPADQGLHDQPDARCAAAGIADYEYFARDILEVVPDRPISFEVFSDDVRRDGASGAEDRVVGRQRLREDPGDQHPGRVDGHADRAARRQAASSST